MKIGFIGLGRMGKNMVLHLLEQGVEVVAWNRSPEKISNIQYQISNLKYKDNFIVAQSLEDLVDKLDVPRTIWLMVTSGEVVDEILAKLSGKLSQGDLVIDGGNSFYEDSIKRNEELLKAGIRFMDVGVSGGIEGARNGACLMIGGDKADCQKIEGLLRLMSAPNAFGLLGPVGAGHFAKMVHNGIEYGMEEAIAEGATLLKNAPFKFNLSEVFKVYNSRSIIESRLVDWAQKELSDGDSLSKISSSIGSAGTDQRVKGEGDWTVDFAKQKNIKVPVIESSVVVRDGSATDFEESPEGFRNKVVNAMRKQFGNHPVGKKSN